MRVVAACVVVAILSSAGCGKGGAQRALPAADAADAAELSKVKRHLADAEKEVAELKARPPQIIRVPAPDGQRLASERLLYEGNANEWKDAKPEHRLAAIVQFIEHRHAADFDGGMTAPYRVALTENYRSAMEISFKDLNRREGETTYVIDKMVMWHRESSMWKRDFLREVERKARPAD